MGKEIERKFLVKSDDYKTPLTSKIYINQGYFAEGVRVRLSKSLGKDEGFITFKSPTEGMTRTEFEYKIPFVEAEEILNNLCKGPIIEKTRHIIFYSGEKWEVDEFFGDNEGLVVAELEMSDEEHNFEKPDWLGEEVTQNKRYYNSDLTKNPFKNWGHLQQELEIVKNQKRIAVEEHNFEEAARLRDIEKSIEQKIELT